ncbi:MAG: hypothetical protein ACD_40C00011G0001 [uncultured bacterium]|nr:MAG: hypothetical protein ACD_40C00011G0001 [uncultured bacterium]
MVPNWISLGDTAGERLSFEKLGGADVAGDLDDIFERELGEPVAVLLDFDEVKVHNFADLFFPGLNIGVNFFLSNQLAACIAFTRVPGQDSTGAKEKNDFVPGPGKVHELAETNGVAKMKIFEGGVESLVEANFFACHQFF